MFWDFAKDSVGFEVSHGLQVLCSNWQAVPRSRLGCPNIDDMALDPCHVAKRESLGPRKPARSGVLEHVRLHTQGVWVVQQEVLESLRMSVTLIAIDFHIPTQQCQHRYDWKTSMFPKSSQRLTFESE